MQLVKEVKRGDSSGCVKGTYKDKTLDFEAAYIHFEMCDCSEEVLFQFIQELL